MKRCAILVVLLTTSLVGGHAFLCNLAARSKPVHSPNLMTSNICKPPIASASFTVSTAGITGTIPAALTPLKMTEVDTGSPKSPKEKLKVGVYFGLWYAFNIAYNIYNKKALNRAPALTYTVGFLQLFVGLIYVIPLWLSGSRATPKLTSSEIKSLIPVTICHALTHLGAIVSLGAGAVSFTHIVKAAEPAVSASLSAIFVRSFLPMPVYLTLLPVMGGVALASMGELSFSMLAFVSAMISNVASASRGIVGKTVLKKPPGMNMDARNLYAVMTILSAMFCLPIALILEGKNIIPTMQTLIAAGADKKFYWETFLSAVTYYLYNEVAFLALDSVSPVTHALGNTIKRVVIILTSVIVFGNKLTPRSAVGSATAIIGVLLYSLAKDRYTM